MHGFQWGYVDNLDMVPENFILIIHKICILNK